MENINRLSKDNNRLRKNLQIFVEEKKEIIIEQKEESKPEERKEEVINNEKNW